MKRLVLLAAVAERDLDLSLRIPCRTTALVQDEDTDGLNL
jgi:hypothetical protein